ncbi:MAG: amidohydrolase family protein [Acidobacteriota bacterium]|nr:amidohydrolase family protein [Acidobacteriota bacterium]
MRGLGLLAFLAIASTPLLFAGSDDSFFLRGATIHTISGADIPNGSILVRDGKIAGVGQKLAIPKDIRVIDGKGLQVYPGMIDSATQIGLSEISAVRETSDAVEIGNFNPELRASIAVNPSSEHIPVARANGITTVISLPDGQLISGQASLIHLDGWTTEEMEVRRSAGLHLHMPVIRTITSTRFASGPNLTTYTDAVKNYEKQMQELNGYFESARRYRQAKTANPPNFRTDLKLEAMLPVIERKEPLFVTAMREREIRAAIEFGEKQKIRIVLAEAPEAWKCAEELKSKNVPVILGPTLALPMNEDDPYDRPAATPAELYKAGVKFAFGSFSTEFSRNLPYQAGNAVAYGLPREEALKAVTLNAAQIWGVADQMGSIDEGKWADLMITDGDPLETQTQIKQLFIKGRAVSLDNKQRRLYEKYMNRP